MNTSLSGTPIITILQNIRRAIRRISTCFEKVPLSELIVQIEEVTIPGQLNRYVNRVQELLWKMPVLEQAPLRRTLVNALTHHVLCSPDASIRLEAARWLRLMVQAGLVTQPADVFVTLVTAAVRVPTTSTAAIQQRTYLTLLLECFWPFRYPYPAYTWEEFPGNEIFYPLATLLPKADANTQEIIITIFRELPELNDRKIMDTFLRIGL